MQSLPPDPRLPLDPSEAEHALHEISTRPNSRGGFDGPADLTCAGCGLEFGRVFDWGRCSRCGIPLSVSRLAAERAALPESQPCVGCGYELKGLAPSGQCPECALPVLDSLRGGQLRHDAPDRLRRLERGLAIAFASSTALLFVQPLAAGFQILIPPIAAGKSWVDLVAAGLWFTLAGAVLTGWWIVAADPPATTSPPPGVARRPEQRLHFLRWLILASAAAECAVLMLAVTGTASTLAALVLSIGTIAPGMKPTAIGVWIAWALTLAGRFWLTTHWLRELALRGGDKTLLNQATRSVWLCPLLASVGCAVFGLGPLIAWSTYLSMLARARFVVERERLLGEQSRAPAPRPSPASTAPTSPAQENGPVV